MLSTIVFFLFGLLLWQNTEPPDIAGQWVGDEWGSVVLKATGSQRYEGTTTNTTDASGVNQEDGKGMIELRWSRLEGRFNGHWKQDGDIGGKLSLRLVDNEIHGAWTTNKKTDVNSRTPRLSELVWKRKDAEQADTSTSIVDRTNPRAVAEAYVASAIQGDVARAGTFAMGTAAGMKNIEWITKNINQKRLPMKSVYVDESATPKKAVAISVQAVLNGYEVPIVDREDDYSKEAIDVLIKFKDAYERGRRNARIELDKLRLNPELIWRDGKPIDPVTDRVAKCIEAVSENDVKMKNIEALLQRIDEGRKAGRPVEELLQMAWNSPNGGTRHTDEELHFQRDIARTTAANIEQFESERVIPLRAEMARLLEQALGESHPSVITAKSRLDKYENELARRKAELKSMNDGLSADGTSRPERVALEDRLKIAYGAQQEILSKLAFEKAQLRAEADALQGKMREHQLLISNYLINLARLEATIEVSEQINENLRKLNLESLKVKLGSKHQLGPREGCLVFALTMNREIWFVTDVNFATMK